LAETLEGSVDLLKIDCEGAEFDILRACGSVLPAARRIIIEVHDVAGDPQEALAIVRNAGFSVSLHQSHPEANAAVLTAVRT
jgi:hypothetical protein